MERQQTDNLLKSHASGTYLIRERPAEAERFAISIKYAVAGGAGRPLPRGHSGPRAHAPMGLRWPWTSLPEAGHFGGESVPVGLHRVAGPGHM